MSLNAQHLPLLRLSSAALAVCALGSPLLAAPVQGPSDEYMISNLPWLPQSSNPIIDEFDAIAHGYLVGDDPLLDVAVLLDGEVWILDGPGERHIVQGVTGTSGTVTALAVQPSTIAGQPDRLILSDSEGLEAWSWNAATEEVLLEAHLTPGTSAPEASAGALQVFHTPNGTPILCGLDATGQGFFTGNLSTTAYTSVSSFSIPIPVQAWTALQWDGVGRPEYAAQTVAGMMVFDHTGGHKLSAALPLNSSAPLLYAYPDAALGADRLVWSTNTAPGGDNLVYQLDNRFPTYEPPLNLGTVVPAAFAIADWTGSDSNDLVVAEFATDAFHIYEGVSNPNFPIQSAHTTSNPETLEVVGGGAAAAEMAFVNVSDFDLDGDDDLFVTHPDFESYLLRGTDIDGTKQMPSKPSNGSHLTLSVATELGGSGPDYHVLKVTLAAPQVGTATDCRVDLFLQESYSGNLVSLDPFASTTAAFTSGKASPSWPKQSFPTEVIQVRATPMENGVQVGPSLIFYFRIYENEPVQVPGGELYFLDSGGGVTGSGGIPPKPKTGPFCGPNC